MKTNKYDTTILQCSTANHMVELIDNLKEIAKLNTNQNKAIVKEANYLIELHKKANNSKYFREAL